MILSEHVLYNFNFISMSWFHLHFLGHGCVKFVGHTLPHLEAIQGFQKFWFVSKL
jgi:hypothetical protein